MSKAKSNNESLSAYRYNQTRPYFTLDNLSCYQGQLKDSPLKFTIKIIKSIDNELVEYLRKMKSNNSDYTVKINQFIYSAEKGQLVIVQQAATYGTLKNALKKCKRLDDDDGVALAKHLLQGHIELLRQGIYWYGDENDIEMTENGVKLSWNNTFPYSENNENPFPALLQRIGMRKPSSSILEFPKNKMLEDLIKVSRENASQMSLHPLLKKKDKVFKKKGKLFLQKRQKFFQGKVKVFQKKGKEWLAIRETKIKGEYMQELSYLAVSKQFGFVRVKVFQKGLLDSEIIKIHQTNPSFVQILNYYEENNNWVTVSEYSNDGTVQNYVKRLKTANIQLKENQIEFFFYSLFHPLKFVNNSPVVSLNFLHIKNIYIHDGIVKIGEPLPLTQVLKQVLKEKADVPDFYHSGFKANPQTKKLQYDTYSLGILIHKLMYTEYPIFPGGVFQMPTAPTYKPKLTSALKLFLTEKSSLEELEQKIEVSEDVKAQVKNNQKVLEQGDDGGAGQKGIIVQEKVKDNLTELSNNNEQQNAESTKTKGKCSRFCTFISKRSIDKDRKYQHLQKSNFSSYRHCTVAFFILALYFFAFFFIYMQGLYNLLAHTRLFSRAEVSILGQLQTVIIPDYDEFLTAYTKYNNTSSLSVLQYDMQCVIDNKNVYFDFVKPSSPHWYMYMLLSLGLMIAILLVKGIQLCKFSTTTVGYHYYDKTIDGQNASRFAVSSYVFFQLWFAMALWAFYYLFNIIYNEQHSPCFGGNNWTDLTRSLLTDRIEFTLNYFILLMSVFALTLLSFLHITLLYQKISYDQLCNPILIFSPLYLGLLIALRVGVFEKFQPSWIHNQNRIIGHSYINVIGYFPEILVLVEVLICLLVDVVFDKCLDKGIQKLLLSQTSFRLDPQVEEERN